MIDFHAHILPGMDDGSESVKDSLRMLRYSASQGITSIVATPHFYAEHESPHSFLKRRGEAWKLLQEGCRGEAGLPGIFPGAEVRMFSGMAASEEIEKLAIAGTRYILIETPFERWTENVFRTLSSVRAKGLHPIIVHIERYVSFQKGTDNIERLLSGDVLIQANAEAFLKRFGSRWAMRMLSQGRVHLLGSDCHNMTSRPPNLGEGAEVIRRKLGEDVIRDISRRAERILDGAERYSFDSRQ